MPCWFGNLLGGFATATGWFLISQLVGHEIAGLPMFGIWVGIAAAKLHSAGTVVDSVEGSGAFENLAASTLQVLGISMYGFWGGNGGYIVYMITMEIVGFFPARVRRVGSVPGAIFYFFKKEGSMVLLIGVLCYIFVFVVSSSYPEVLNSGTMSQFVDYVILCISYFLWIALGSGIAVAISARAKG